MEENEHRNKRSKKAQTAKIGRINRRKQKERIISKEYTINNKASDPLVSQLH